MLASSSVSIAASRHDCWNNDSSYSLDELMPPLRSDLEVCVCRNRWHRSQQVQEKDLEINILNEELKIIYSRFARLEKTCEDQKIQLQEMDSLRRQVEYLSSGWETHCRIIKDFCSKFEWSIPSEISEKTPSGTNERLTELDQIAFNIQTFLCSGEDPDNELDVQTGKSWTELSSREQDFCSEFEWSIPSEISEKTPSGTNERLTELDQIAFSIQTFLCSGEDPDNELDVQTGKSWTELSSREQNFCSEFEWSIPSEISEKTPSGTNERLTELDQIAFSIQTFLCSGEDPDKELDVETGKSWTELSSREQASGKDHDSKQINPYCFYELIDQLNSIFD